MATTTTGANGDTTTTRSLYDRLGGKAAITAVIDTFVARVAADPRINRSSPLPLRGEASAQVDQVCQPKTGGCPTTGRSMKDAHRGMKVTEGEFNALVEDLVAALNRFGMPEQEHDECCPRGEGDIGGRERARRREPSFRRASSQLQPWALPKNKA